MGFLLGFFAEIHSSTAAEPAINACLTAAFMLELAAAFGAGISPQITGIDGNLFRFDPLFLIKIPLKHQGNCIGARQDQLSVLPYRMRAANPFYLADHLLKFNA